MGDLNMIEKYEGSLKKFIVEMIALKMKNVENEHAKCEKYILKLGVCYSTVSCHLQSTGKAKNLIKGKSITFCWSPGHVYIQGNKASESAAARDMNFQSVPFFGYEILFKFMINLNHWSSNTTKQKLRRLNQQNNKCDFQKEKKKK